MGSEGGLSTGSKRTPVLKDVDISLGRVRTSESVSDDGPLGRTDVTT